MEWLLPGAYAHAVSQKPANQESKLSLSKLMKATPGLKYESFVLFMLISEISLPYSGRCCKFFVSHAPSSVPSFYIRVKKWAEIANLSPAARDIFNQADRYFSITRAIFERFELMFNCIFRDPLDQEMLDLVSPRAMSLRKKQYGEKCFLFLWLCVYAGFFSRKMTFPRDVQAVDVYVFAWDLFIRARREYFSLCFLAIYRFDQSINQSMHVMKTYTFRWSINQSIECTWDL